LKITLCRDGENKPEKFDTDNGGFIMIRTENPDPVSENHILPAFFCVKGSMNLF
jgi:hypothetical protein